MPSGVTSAFITMAGGGGSGAGWRMVNANYSGHSGGYVFSQPVNFVAGEVLSIVVGAGGVGYAPVAVGCPSCYYVPPAGDDGLGGYPGGASKIVSPTNGTLLECDGGSGATFGYFDSYAGGPVAGGLSGALTGSGTGTFIPPNRVATGSYAAASSPGACGPSQYGIGNPGEMSFSMASGGRLGGTSPFGYGSGGAINVSGCYTNAAHTTTGTCIYAGNGRDGVVIVDVLY